MCGIAGIVSFGEQDPVSQREDTSRMLAAIRHRGPDEFGIYQDPAATLGSARLSIIDLSTGRQPISNEDGTLWIVFNGEIFNFIELRRTLEERGHRFSTRTDTEVLLHMYEDSGEDCLQELNGQFAVAIWDARKRTLFLGRDRTGIRPLFYTRAAHAFVFASEVKALFFCSGVRREIDPVSLDQTFVYWSPLPGRTVFRDVYELPSGHLLTLSERDLTTKRYWAWSFPAGSGTSNNGDSNEVEYLAELNHLLSDATALRLRSDVPVAAYLSGGLDSSVLAAMIRTQTGDKLNTFSITFDDPDFDESDHQMRVSRFLGTEHHVVKATYADIGRVFPEVVWHTEAPLMRTAPAPMFLLSERVRDSGFKVVVTGEGADEVLAGYDIFKEAAIRRFCAKHPESRLRPALFQRLYADIPRLGAGGAMLSAFFMSGMSGDETASPFYSHLVRWRNNARARRFFSDDVLHAARPATVGCLHPLELPPSFATWGTLQQAQYLEATVFLSQYLLSSQGDRMGMAHSVESRMPFLDYRVVQFCNGLPSFLKLRSLTNDKYLLRRLGREILPLEVAQRPKRPYRAPIHRSFFGTSAPEYVHELLCPARIRSAGLFNPEPVERLVRKARSGARLSETDDMAVAGILSTQLVWSRFISAFPAPRPLGQHDAIAFCGSYSTAVS